VKKSKASNSTKPDAQVTFTANPGKTVTRKNLGQVSDAVRQDEMADIFSHLEQFKERTQQLQSDIQDNFAIEDPKLLGIIMEHILLHWDDIVACLVDELIEEEVIELNRVEDAKLKRN
jgi:hypothetical protein